MSKVRFLVFLLALGLVCLTSDARADWSVAKRLTWTSGWSGYPKMAIDSNDAIHIVWIDDTPPGNYDIFYKSSPDGGTTWSSAKRLTWTSGSFWDLAIAIDSSDAIHVIWRDSTPGNAEIYYRSSTDGGTTWSSAKRLTWTSGSSRSPAIAIGPTDAIHVVWYDTTPGNNEIYYKSSPDGGATWSPARRLTWTSGDSIIPAMAIDPNNAIHIIWEDDTPGNDEIYYNSSPDGGTTWGFAKRLTWTSLHSHSPAIAMDSGNAIHIVWDDNTTGDFEIYYKRSPDGGAAWNTAKRLTWTAVNSEEPAMTIDASDNIHVAWNDYVQGDSEIYYKRSTDGGTTWSASQRLTWTLASSSYPAIATDSTDTVHIVWMNDTPGNHEIYYKFGN